MWSFPPHHAFLTEKLIHFFLTLPVRYDLATSKDVYIQNWAWRLSSLTQPISASAFKLKATFFRWAYLDTLWIWSLPKQFCGMLFFFCRFPGAIAFSFFFWNYIWNYIWNYVYNIYIYYIYYIYMYIIYIMYMYIIYEIMYDRYVDDVFSFFVSKAKSAEFFKRLNSLHPALRFTVEGEENGSLPFLDVRATKTASGIVTSIFRKPTFTGLYTPWDSFSPTVYKVNLVRSLAHRIIRICSPTTVEGELTALRDILAKNGYPGELLDRFVTTDQPTRREGPRPCPLTLRVPWLGSKTEKLVRRANDAVRLAYPAGEVRAVYRTNKAFNLPKDRIPIQSQSNLIYQFECRQCGSRYVGKTAQRFVDRISQHVPKHILDAVLDPQRKRPGRPPKKRDNPAEGYQSAVACHLAANADCCRSYRESDFTVLSK